MSKSTVLVVEDEEDILEVIQYNLEQEGYEVVSCMDGLQGLEQAKKLKPDLVPWTLCCRGWMESRSVVT